MLFRSPCGHANRLAPKLPSTLPFASACKIGARSLVEQSFAPQRSAIQTEPSRAAATLLTEPIVRPAGACSHASILR